MRARRTTTARLGSHVPGKQCLFICISARALKRNLIIEKMTEKEENSSLFNAEAYFNSPDIEIAWIEKAVQHMEIHYNLISSVPAKGLRLTPHDNEIHDKFIADFPDFKLDILDIKSLKSEESKQKWRDFCNHFKEIVDDATFGTLVRVNCAGEYDDDNTILVVRVQFLAIEIARNRLGLNDSHLKKEKS